MDSSDAIAAIQDQLTQAQLAHQQALQLSHFKGTFLARTSHELRAPLSSLMGLHQLILSDLCDSPEEEREFVRQAHEAAQRLLALLDKIVYVSKLDQGSNQLDIRAVPLANVLAEVENLTQLQAANRAYPLTIAAPDPTLMIQGDEKRLLQTLVSLVDTAIAHMKEGSLALTHQLQGEQVSLDLTIQSPQVIWSAGQIAELAPQSFLTAEATEPSPNIASPTLTWILGEAILQQMDATLTLIASPDMGDAVTTVQVALVQGSILE